MNNSVAILILFYNKLNQTIECINSFLPSNQKIYVLNNGSHCTQWEKLQAKFKSQKTVILMDAKANIGVSGGRNFLITSTDEPWIFSVDNDIQVRPTKGWIQQFENFILNTPQAKIICPAVFNVHENKWGQQVNIKKIEKRIRLETGDLEESNCFPGGASIVHRSIFRECGLFDEEMFIGFEDYEYGLRAMLSDKGDLKAFHCNEIKLIHDHRFQKGSKDKEAVRQRYNEEKLKMSFDRMVSKYNIEFEHDWRWWCQKQVQDMTVNKTFTKIRRKISTWLGR